MKTLTIREAQNQLGELIAEAHQGGIIVLTDGSRKVWLDTRAPLDPEEDSAELEEELLKAADGPFKPYSPEKMQAVCERVARELREDEHKH